NCGSSSLKFQIIQTDTEAANNNTDHRLSKGLIERIGAGQSNVSLQVGDNPSKKETLPLPDHHVALQYILKWIVAPETKIPGINTLQDIHAVGHRILNGGERFINTMIITDEVYHGIEECIDLAPLHNPANLKGVAASQEAFGPHVPNVAVFDTAFHSTMREEAYIYAIPYELYQKYKLRRYGAHGTSHRYVTLRYQQLTGKSPQDTNIITMHLGNGCSACAVKHGISYDTSMGLSPLEGLVMGTRSGDIDPAVLTFLSHKEPLNMDDFDTLLNKKSGLLGISGLTNDLRDLEDAALKNHKRAKLAIDIFVQRIKKYLGAYLAEMNGADAIVFTGGIGENSSYVRERACKKLERLGIEIDLALNEKTIRGKEGEINTANSKVKIFVIPTNEELLIARDTFTCVEATKAAHRNIDAAFL
ncbi:MAG TPA: acetate kinase, partial [Bacteroidota bacterium]|nr:acetate kinase [Bacteroidota bacterium]